MFFYVILLDRTKKTNYLFFLGSNCFYLAKDMRCNDVYTFRVRCLTENSTIWSAWSRPYVVSTHLKPFMWSTVSTDYKLTNDNTIATKCSTHTAIIYSDSAQFHPNYSIEFTVRFFFIHRTLIALESHFI